MINWLISHLQNCIAALGVMSRQPVATALTVAVIGIALSLPAAMSILVTNGRQLAGGWEDVRDFSVYLVPGAAVDSANALGQELGALSEIANVTIVPADDALESFRNDPAFADMLGALDNNPLPHALVVRPAEDTRPDWLERLGEQLIEREEVDLVRLDTEWLMRLNAGLELVRRAVVIAAVLLLGAVVIIVGNTIRLDIQNRRQEIEVSRLLGASNGFIRRPFLYTGFWYGLAGGIFALLLLAGTLMILSGPIERLADLYDSAFQSVGLQGDTVLAVIGGGLAAGLGGAWIAVSRHLAAIQPTV